MQFMSIRFEKLICLAAIFHFAAFASMSFGQDFLREPRPLAPGVLKVVPAELDVRDTYTLPMELPDLAAENYLGNFVSASQTLFGQTQNVILFRDAWQIEFATTGLRQVKLRFARPDGSTLDRHYWYMVYRIRDMGKSLSYKDVAAEGAIEYIKKELEIDLAKTDRSIGPQKFLSRFTLEGWAQNLEGVHELKTWNDIYSPEVTKQIQRLEDPNVKLYNQQEMSELKIPLSENEASPGIWSVAIWEDVDPSINFVSVFVNGLTNAWRIDPDSRDAKSISEIKQLKKTLQMNFWRPGDSVLQERDMVQYGIPLVDGSNEQIEICRRYRLPGPVLNIYYKTEEMEEYAFMAGVDGEVSLEDFQSPLVAELDAMKIPAVIAEALAARSVVLADSVALSAEVPGNWWKFDAGTPNGTASFKIRMEPQFWEKKGEGIRFIGTLENFWIYR